MKKKTIFSSIFHCSQPTKRCSSLSSFNSLLPSLAWHRLSYQPRETVTGWQKGRHIQTLQEQSQQHQSVVKPESPWERRPSGQRVGALGLKPPQGSRPAHQVPRLSYTLRYDTTTSCSDNKEELSRAWRWWRRLPFPHRAMCYVKRLFCATGVKAPNLMLQKPRSRALI